MKFPASLISAICISILCGSVNAQSDLVSLLLDLPAPPAVNTSFNPGRGTDTPGFFDHRFPPHEDAPIDEILLYWQHWNEIEPGTSFTIIPSLKTVERILAEIEDEPGIATDYLNVISYYRESGYRISDILDANKHNGKIPRANHSSLNAWIRLNSDRDIDEVEELAQKISDAKGQPSTRAELETLARVDWSRAEPIVKKLEESKRNPISRSFAHFLRYKHAVQVGNSKEASVSIELLQKTVEDREAKAEVRDFALAALAQAGDFPGKDEWYFSLLEDETLSDIEFSEQKLAGLTSFIIHSPPEKYVDKMVFLARSPLLITRNAAVRNLAELLKHNDPRVVRAMIPWLYEKDWVGLNTKHREDLVLKLQTIRDFESVGGLVSFLEEMDAEVIRIDEPENPHSERSVKSAKARSDSRRGKAYDLRLETAKALGNQRDTRAIDRLNWVLPVHRKKDRVEIVKALLACGGFTPEVQIQALEQLALTSLDEARDERALLEGRVREFGLFDRIPLIKEDISLSPSWVPIDESDRSFGWGITNRISTISSGSSAYVFGEPEPFDPAEIPPLLQTAVAEQTEPSEPFLTSLLNRMLALKQLEPMTVLRMKQLSRNWFGREYNEFLLNQLSHKETDIYSVLRLLTERQYLLKENRVGLNRALDSENPASRAIAACISEDAERFNKILLSSDDAAKSFLYACTRLIKAELPLEITAGNLKSPDSQLATAAVVYLESLDTPESRDALYKAKPDQARILGSTRAFGFKSKLITDDVSLRYLFISTGISSSSMNDSFFKPDSDYFVNVEDKLRRQITSDKELTAIYWFENNLVKVYADRIEYIWADDPARYWKRTLTSEEQGKFAAVLAEGNSANAPAFLGRCGHCEERQLITIKKNGGRRVYFSFGSTPEFAANLDRLFTGFRRTESSLHYWTEDRLPSLEILFGREHVKIIALVNDQNRHLAALEDQRLAARIEADLERHRMEDLDNPLLEPEEVEWRRSQNLKGMPLEAVGWYELESNGIGSKVTAPTRVESITDVRQSQLQITDIEATKVTINTPTGPVDFATSQRGLFVRTTKAFELIRNGEIRRPIVDDNNTSVLFLARAGLFDSSLVLFNSKREYLIEIGAPAGYNRLFPDRYIPTINRFLVLAKRVADESVGATEKETGFLVDPINGSLESISYDKLELLRHEDPEMQEKVDGNSKWGAIRRGDGTAIVQYNPINLNHKEVLFVPWIRFTGDKMIVTDNGASAMIVYNGHLLRIRLKK